ncbi:hypothetical protein CRG98_034711 [Punica granatum]|uniref:Uncharacterized protein n=1 Tax=Punica granatum TaxID=22663 RepID=A0A2I0IM22_PUNGR|nr:hypothetical protein CRG98_034711 [Punica granatum]
MAHSGILRRKGKFIKSRERKMSYARDEKRRQTCSLRTLVFSAIVSMVAANYMRKTKKNPSPIISATAELPYTPPPEDEAEYKNSKDEEDEEDEEELLEENELPTTLPPEAANAELTLQVRSSPQDCGHRGLLQSFKGSEDLVHENLNWVAPAPVGVDQGRVLGGEAAANTQPRELVMGVDETERRGGELLWWGQLDS